MTYQAVPTLKFLQTDNDDLFCTPVCSLWWPFPLKVLPQSANAGVFLFGSGLPKPQSTQVPGPLAKEVGAGLCFPAYLGCPGPGEVERGPLGAQRSRSKKLSLFWSLIPVQQLTPGQIAMKQSPCSRPPAACLSAPAPEDFSSSRVKKKKKQNWEDWFSGSASWPGASSLHFLSFSFK